MKYDYSLEDAVICDLDSTLALLNGRNPYDASMCEQDSVNGPIADIVKTYCQDDYRILIVTGRYEQYRDQTERWLGKYAIPYYALFMRPDGDYRKDYDLKREIYEQYILGHYNVHFVLDDRKQSVDLWRFLGLTCLQVANN